MIFNVVQKIVTAVGTLTVMVGAKVLTENKFLCLFPARHLKMGFDAPHTVIEGEIPEAIADEAARTHASLIVTGRGLAQAKFSAMWSRLFPIVRLAPCPVLSI